MSCGYNCNFYCILLTLLFVLGRRRVVSPSRAELSEAALLSLRRLCRWLRPGAGVATPAAVLLSHQTVSQVCQL